MSGVIFLLDSLAVGGSELKTVRIANALAQRGAAIHIGYLNTPDTLLGQLTQPVGRTFLDRRGKFSWKSVRRLAEYVHAHRVKRVVAVNLYPLLYAYSLRLVMGKSAPACIAAINTTEFHERKHALQMAIYAPLLRRLDSVVFGCRYQMDVWVKRYKLSEARCTVIYNGVDCDQFSPINGTALAGDVRLQLMPNALVVGTVGKFRPEKRQQDLIEAIRIVRARGTPVAALLVGSGNEEATLKDLTHARGLENSVHFLGQLEDVRPALAAMDVFVLTSFSETFSNAALEAMAMGKPVILSDVGGAREMVQDGANGRLYPAMDVECLADLIDEMAAHREQLAAMGAEARKICVERFSFARMIERYRMLCEAGE